MQTVFLLVLSNIFMTFAWYGHLGSEDWKRAALWKVVMISWGIAFLEYCFQVPANRIGAVKEGFSTAQLKIIQEIITLCVFCVFSVYFLKEKLAWNYLVGFGLMVAAVFFVFYFQKPAAR